MTAHGEDAQCEGKNAPLVEATCTVCGPIGPCNEYYAERHLASPGHIAALERLVERRRHFGGPL